MLQDTSFILEATRLTENYNLNGAKTTNVDPNLYFLALHKDTVLFQMGLSTGENWGASGTTVQSKLCKMKIKKNPKKGPTRISGYFASSLGEFRLDMRIVDYGIATASIEHIRSDKEIIFRGDIKHLKDNIAYVSGPIQ